MNFFQKIKNSVFSPSFYSSLSSTSFGSAFGYFFLLILFLVLIQAFFIAKPLFVDFPNQVNIWLKNAPNYYPGDLEIKFTGGKAYPNVKEPYFVPLSDKNIATTSADYQNLIVIDTKTPFSASRFNDYKTLAWLTQDSIFYQSREGSEIKGYDLTKIKDFTLNKRFVISLIDQISPWTKFIGPALIIFAFLGLYLAYTLKLLQLLFIALLIFFLAKLFKWGLTYAQSYKVGLYAITLGLIVELVISLIAKFTYFTGFPFMFTLITLGVVFVNLNTPKKSE